MTTETTDPTVAKRPRVTDNTSPDKRDSLIQELPGNNAPYCRKVCTCKSEMLQCDLGAVWVHAHCKGYQVSYTKLKLHNYVFSSVSNLHIILL